MNILTFSTLILLLQAHLPRGYSRHDIVCMLFQDYLGPDTFDCSQTTKWSNGGRPVPVTILRYYHDHQHLSAMTGSIERDILPEIADCAAFRESLSKAVERASMSTHLEQSFLTRLSDPAHLGHTLAELLLYAMGLPA